MHQTLRLKKDQINKVYKDYCTITSIQCKKKNVTFQNPKVILRLL